VVTRWFRLAAAILVIAAGFVPPAASISTQATSSDPGEQPPPPQTSSGHNGMPALLAVVGGTLIDGTGADPIPDSAIIIEGDRIKAAGPRRQIRIPPGAIPIDATDLTVIPGLIDVHVHLIEGIDVRSFLEHGVTSVRHLGDTTLPWITGLKKRIESNEIAGPRIFHCGLFVVSEPPLKPEIYPPEALDRFMVMRSPADAPAIVRRLLEAGADVVKVKMEMSPESLRAIGVAAAEARIPMTFDSGGDTGDYDAVTAFDAGARGIEHLSGINFSDPAATEAALRKMIAVGAFADPTFMVLERTYSEDRIAAREEFIRRFVAMGGTVVAGSDVPVRGIMPGHGLHQEMARLVKAGLTSRQALMAATGAAARALGYQGIVGTIEAGAYADLVIVHGDPIREISAAEKIVRVLKGGREVHPFPEEAVSPGEPQFR